MLHDGPPPACIAVLSMFRFLPFLLCSGSWTRCGRSIGLAPRPQPGGAMRRRQQRRRQGNKRGSRQRRRQRQGSKRGSRQQSCNHNSSNLKGSLSGQRCKGQNCKGNGHARRARTWRQVGGGPATQRL